MAYQMPRQQWLLLDKLLANIDYTYESVDLDERSVDDKTAWPE